MSSSAPGPAVLVSIVDDDSSVRRALRRLVESAGFSAETFASGRQAIDIGFLARAACLIIDVHLGDMTGFDLQRILVSEGTNVPVIFITAHDDGPTWDNARRAGAIAYLAKPVDGDLLLDAIRHAVGAA